MIELLHGGKIIGTINSVERIERTPVYSEDGRTFLYTRFTIIGHDAGKIRDVHGVKIRDVCDESGNVVDVEYHGGRPAKGS